MRCTARARRALSLRKNASNASPSRWSSVFPEAATARRSSGSAAAAAIPARSASRTGAGVPAGAKMPVQM